MSGNNRVFALRCEDYSEAEEKIHELFAMMGGPERFVRPDERILVKPNLLLAADPSRAVTTHPSVVSAVSRQVRAAGGSICIADSPGSGYAFNRKTLLRLYRVCGMKDAADGSDAELSWDTTYQSRAFSQGGLIKRFEVISPFVNCAGMINLCKLKTHTLTAMTGAVKNIFGIIPGRLKTGYHSKLRDKLDFCGMLLDLAELAAPRLSIMDGILGMEGNGPGGGTPKRVGWLLASESPLALDVTSGWVMGLDPGDNPLLKEAKRRGLFPFHPEDVRLEGADWEEIRIPDFKLPVGFLSDREFARIPRFLEESAMRIIRRGAALTPRIIKEKCVSCGACRDACPVGAVKMKKGASAVIDTRSCIRCYCCHEMCAHGAVELRSGFLFRMVNGSGAHGT